MQTETASQKSLAERPIANVAMTSRSVMGVLAPGAVESRPIRDLVSPAEWQVRVDLAAAYRLMVKYGMSDMIYNHLTARCPDRPDEFLINAYGLHYSEISASNLHRVNHEGEITQRGNSHYGINYPGFIIHGAIHEARADVNCIIHAHTRAGIAVSAMKVGLQPLSLAGMRFCERIGYHDCRGIVTDMAERELLVEAIGPHNVLMLRNHGTLACGPTVAEAFNTQYMLEQACKIQVDAMAGGAELVIPAPEVIAQTVHMFQPGVRRAFGVMEWEAMLRLLDKEDPSFRD
ncbi:MAG: class II aldolase/adducin family protein [Pseudomonadota bacterium]